MGGTRDVQRIRGRRLLMRPAREKNHAASAVDWNKNARRNLRQLSVKPSGQKPPKHAGNHARGFTEVVSCLRCVEFRGARFEGLGIGHCRAFRPRPCDNARSATRGRRAFWPRPCDNARQRHERRGLSWAARAMLELESDVRSDGTGWRGGGVSTGVPLGVYAVDGGLHREGLNLAAAV